MVSLYQSEILLFFVIYAITSTCTATEERSVTTSVASMVELLETEHLLVSELESYSSALQSKLNLIKGVLETMKDRDQRALHNTEKYLENPLNAYALIRRLHADWINWELFLKEPIGQEHVEEIRKLRQTIRPTDQELSEATSALQRLQEVYDLEVQDMAMGKINGRIYEDRLTALDCFAIGHKLFDSQKYFDASFWLYTALQAYEENDVNLVHEFSREEILLLYGEALVHQGRMNDALSVIDSALTENPHNAWTLRRKAQVEVLAKMNVPPLPYPERIISAYELGCRGKFGYPTSRKLFCTYNQLTTAFLKLAPIKMETLNLDPYFVIYHDVLTNSEIKELQELALPSLKRATVLGPNGTSKADEKRTSKFAWFPDGTTEVTKRINDRIADMTGFDLRGSEMLQVMNYGLGGHYETHFDFFNVTSDNSVVKTNGDRIATVLFYLNDVEQGGATVFPSIKLAVYPRKGSAVMWYNLNNKGEGDARTLHAACPVLVGSKWVCNKWIRERQQMFRKPCLK